jgi:hypothetical protein
MLGDDIIGHCEKKQVPLNMCLILNDYRDKSILNFQTQLR